MTFYWSSWVDRFCKWINEATARWWPEALWLISTALVSGMVVSYWETGLIFGGEWWEAMTAFGTVGAVVISLWLADWQRRRDVESLLVTPSMSMFAGCRGGLFCVNVVSNGIRPATVKGVAIVSKHTSAKLQVLQFFRQNMQLPACLQYGDSLYLECNVGFHEKIERFLAEDCDSRTDGLEIEISTTLQSFKTPVDGLLLDLINRSFQFSAE